MRAGTAMRAATRAISSIRWGFVRSGVERAKYAFNETGEELNKLVHGGASAIANAAGCLLAENAEAPKACDLGIEFSAHRSEGSQECCHSVIVRRPGRTRSRRRASAAHRLGRWPTS